MEICKSFQRKRKPKKGNKYVVNIYLQIPFSSWISFHPIPIVSKGPDKASLSWTVLVRLPLAEDEDAFTFRLFFGLLQEVSHGLTWKCLQLQEAAAAERREGNQQPLS